MSAVLELADALAQRAHLDPALLSERHLAPLLAERRRALKIDSDEQYARRALQSVTEFGRLRDLIAVPETWLFRYLASFEVLRDALRQRGCRKLDALSVPCATGAEPLSIAATALAAGVPASKVRVVAVDSSRDALGHARVGKMTRLSAREGVPEWAAPWFVRHPECIDATEELLGCVQWIEGTAPQVLDELDDGSFDAIFCRNLGIYLRASVRRTLGKRLARLLAPSGMLFLGHAEPPGMFGLTEGVTAVEPRASFAFTRCAAPANQKPGAEIARSPGAAARLAGWASATPQRGDSEVRALRETRGPRETSGVPVAPVKRESLPEPPPSIAAVRAAADSGRLHEALELGARLAATGDRSCELLLLMGSAHAALEAHDEAERVLRQVVYLEPSNAEALLQLATLADRRGDSNMATRYRTRAARATPPREGAA